MVSRPPAGQPRRHHHRQPGGRPIRSLKEAAPGGAAGDLPDTPELAARRGRPGASRGARGFPQLRLLTLIETGTHALWALAMGRYDASEARLAPELPQQLRPRMLCLADRAFVGLALWREAAASGADLLWRVRANQILPCRQRLADGSYLSRLSASPKDRRPEAGGRVVRVIDHRLEGLPDAAPMYRLVTTRLEPGMAPAAELAALYHERWESEGVLAELKVTLPVSAGVSGALRRACAPCHRLRHAHLLALPSPSTRRCLTEL